MATDLYDELIMDHIKNARNYRVPHAIDRQASRANPLCGDEMLVYMATQDGQISDVAFQCTCCGISMASASVMTDSVKGKHLDHAQRLLEEFVAMVNGRGEPAPHSISAEWLALLKTVKKFPTRAQCALLPWEALAGMLNHRQ